MRIWDLPPSLLCRQHLLGEHRELHALWTILTEGKGGYRHHPETKRWVGKLGALSARHNELVLEMERRGYKHKSPLHTAPNMGEIHQTVFVHTPEQQRDILRKKNCECLRR